MTYLTHINSDSRIYMPKSKKNVRASFWCALRTFAGFMLLAASTSAAYAQNAAVNKNADIDTLIHKAYNYAFPLFKLSQFRWTALETTDARTSTTLNRFVHSRKIATPEDRWANSPIVEALYSTAWIDLAQGPVMMETPDTNGRYFVLTLIDFYSNTFLYAGHRTTGTAAQRHYLVGPDWRGVAPTDAQVVRATTNDVYVNLRVQVNGPADEPAANRIQDGFNILPSVSPSKTIAARVRPATDDPKNFLDIVNQMLALAPPPARDHALIKKYKNVGICGIDCDWNRLPAGIQIAWRNQYPELERRFLKSYLSAGLANGWINYNPPGSKLGTTEQRDYDLRALALAMGMGMLGLSREEANYWITFRDAQARPLLGRNRYRFRLPPGGIPSNAFWSISLYAVDKDGQFLAENPINRYQVSSMMSNLITNADGSIDIWLQPESPADTKVNNWLPTPADGRAFTLFARAYEPTGDVLKGAFPMPLIEEQD